jgi:hypothetical protein
MPEAATWTPGSIAGGLQIFFKTIPQNGPGKQSALKYALLFLRRRERPHFMACFESKGAIIK